MKYQSIRSIKCKFLIEKKLFIIFILCILNLGHLAHSAILIKPSIGASSISHRDDFAQYISESDGDFGNDIKNPRGRSFGFIGNLGIYFQFDAGFFAGVTYDMNFININNYLHINTSGLGVTTGYMHAGWYISATYLFFISGQKSLRQDSDSDDRFQYNRGNFQYETRDISLNRGMGALIQAGYVHFFSDMIGIGPSVQARSFFFSEIICTQGIAAQCGSSSSGSGISSRPFRQTYRTFDISLLIDVFFKI